MNSRTTQRFRELFAALGAMPTALRGHVMHRAVSVTLDLKRPVVPCPRKAVGMAPGCAQIYRFAKRSIYSTSVKMRVLAALGPLKVMLASPPPATFILLTTN